MKNKNKVLLILIGILLLSVGLSLAYFVTKVLQSGTGGSIVTTTAVIHGADIKVEGTLEFNDTDIYPGYMNVSGIKVTATGDNELIPYNLVWKGSNGISQINYNVYKTSSPVTSTSNCEKKMEVVNGIQQYSEECTISNLDKLGTAIESGSIKKNDTKVVLVKDEFITATSDGQTVYYYVVLEYPNLSVNQSDDIGATFDGLVTVEESDKKPDINILAVKLEQEDGTYKETEDIPTEGYTFNAEKSTCSNGAIPKWDNYNNGLLTTNITKSGTSCYLYFAKNQTVDTIVADIEKSSNFKTGTPTFSEIATGAETEENNGIFVTDDPMYGENAKTYYWRGAATTNHVVFDNKCWRIVRINGDGSIRLIYNGTTSGTEPNQTCTGNGTTANSVVLSGTAYNSSNNNSKYVGWTYASGDNQRPSTNVPQNSGTSSLLKTKLETWYKDNISDIAKTKVVEGKFCNDRNTRNNETWRATGETQYYAAYERLIESSSKTPQLTCSKGDIYSLDVGMITADEVQFAGASGTTSNTSYYLYNGQYYWTMSPSYWRYNSAPYQYAHVFYVDSDDGRLGYDHAKGVVSWINAGVRPVINLRSDVTFNAGSDGTAPNPYIVQ